MCFIFPNKLKFNTREEAKQKMKATNPGNNPKQQVYLCQSCGYFHIGRVGRMKSRDLHRRAH